MTSEDASNVWIHDAISLIGADNVNRLAADLIAVHPAIAGDRVVRLYKMGHETGSRRLALDLFMAYGASGVSNESWICFAAQCTAGGM